MALFALSRLPLKWCLLCMSLSWKHAKVINLVQLVSVYPKSLLLNLKLETEDLKVFWKEILIQSEKDLLET